MRRLNGFAILLAVVLAVAYLITRPHLGTIIVESFTYVRDGPVDTNPFNMPEQRPPFSTYAECEKDATEKNGQLAAATGWVTTCESKTPLLWGW